MSNTACTKATESGVLLVGTREHGGSEGLLEPARPGCDGLVVGKLPVGADFSLSATVAR
jgi:hypothetical protein